MRNWTWFNRLSLVLGFSFLYLPILLLVIYSFNESRLVTVWAGFSTKWYASLMENSGILNAAEVTIQVALVASTLATALGTLAGLAIARFRRFPGRTLFNGMIYAPMVMPDVIIGLSLLLMFVSISLDRGIVTVIMAHTTFSMCYVAVVIQSRFASFDQSIEEAALDLGCPPLKTFFVITLPTIMPAVVSGWLLSFTLSLDDLVISSFTTGPGATTLPMKIYSMVRLGVTPEINAISTILIGLVASGVLVASLLHKRNEARRMEAQALAAGR